MEMFRKEDVSEPGFTRYIPSSFKISERLHVYFIKMELYKMNPSIITFSATFASKFHKHAKRAIEI